MTGPEDEIAPAAARDRGRLRASHADREQAIEVLKVPWPRNSEGDPPHGVVLLVYLTTLIYLFVLAMTLWLGGAVLVESWLKRRSGGRRAGRTSLWQIVRRCPPLAVIWRWSAGTQLPGSS